MGRKAKKIEINGRSVTLKQAASYFLCSYNCIYRLVKRYDPTEVIKRGMAHRKLRMKPCESCGAETKGIVCNTEPCRLKRAAKLYQERMDNNPEARRRYRSKYTQDRSQQFDAGKRGKNDHRCEYALNCANYDRYMEKSGWKKPCTPDGKCFDPIGSDENRRDIMFNSILEGV